MSRSGKAFEIGGIVVPLHAALDMQQIIEPLSGGSAVLRLGAGAAIKQSTWEKSAIRISASGWCPPGLGTLDYAAPLVLKCGLPQAVTTNTTTAALPPARRSDSGYAPFARAHTGVDWHDTPVSLAGDVATITAVAGALAYQVWYWPQFVVYASPPSTTFDQATAVAVWEMACEEV